MLLRGHGPDPRCQIGGHHLHGDARVEGQWVTARLVNQVTGALQVGHGLLHQGQDLLITGLTTKGGNKQDFFAVSLRLSRSPKAELGRCAPRPGVQRVGARHGVEARYKILDMPAVD